MEGWAERTVAAGEVGERVGIVMVYFWVAARSEVGGVRGLILGMGDEWGWGLTFDDGAALGSSAAEDDDVFDGGVGGCGWHVDFWAGASSGEAEREDSGLMGDFKGWNEVKCKETGGQEDGQEIS